MFYLLLGLVFFVGIHLFSMVMPVQRDGLKLRVGEGPFKGIFLLISLMGLGLIVAGYRNLSSGPAAGDLLYEPAAGMRHVAMLLVLLAFISVSASHGKGYLKLWLRQPMSIGFALWAFGHLLANGERHGVYLFGSILVLALLDIILSTVRGKVPGHEPRVRSDIVAVVAGTVLYAIFLFGFHPYVLHVPII